MFQFLLYLMGNRRLSPGANQMNEGPRWRIGVRCVWKWTQALKDSGRTRFHIVRNGAAMPRPIGTCAASSARTLSLPFTTRLTAMPGICAKPTVDLMSLGTILAALDAREEAALVTRLERRGEFCIPGRRFLSLVAGIPPAKRLFNVHCFRGIHAGIERHLAFLDYCAASQRQKHYEAEKFRTQKGSPEPIHAPPFQAKGSLDRGIRREPWRGTGSARRVCTASALTTFFEHPYTCARSAHAGVTCRSPDDGVLTLPGCEASDASLDREKGATSLCSGSRKAANVGKEIDA